MYAFDVGNGEVIWEQEAPYHIKGSPVVIGGVLDGNIHFVTETGVVQARSALTGAVLWSQELGATVHSSPAYDVGTGYLYVGDRLGRVTALLAADGGVVWQFSTAPYGGGPVDSSPAYTPDFIYFGVGGSSGGVYPIDKFGGLVWSYIDDSIPGSSNIGYSSPAVGPGGTIYIASQTGRLYAIDSLIDSDPDAPALPAAPPGVNRPANTTFSVYRSPGDPRALPRFLGSFSDLAAIDRYYGALADRGFRFRRARR